MIKMNNYGHGYKIITIIMIEIGRKYVTKYNSMTIREAAAAVSCVMRVSYVSCWINVWQKGM